MAVEKVKESVPIECPGNGPASFFVALDLTIAASNGLLTTRS
jgi:hypothetical protein